MRRLILATVGVMLTVTVPGAHAASAMTLDGKGRTHVRYTGNLKLPAVKVSGDRMRADILTPSVADCGVTSCDITQVRLLLPRGTSTGRLTVAVTVDRTLNGYVVLYDGKGQQVHAVDLVGAFPACCTGTETTYVLAFTEWQLYAGKYSLVLFDRGGAGNFTADVEFKAHPPDRQKAKK